MVVARSQAAVAAPALAVAGMVRVARVRAEGAVVVAARLGWADPTAAVSMVAWVARAAQEVDIEVADQVAS